MTNSYETLQIRFQTAAAMPPPYAYFYTIDLQPEQDQIRVNFEVTYTDRDELDEDEIIAEGFTTSDDFSWSGGLPGEWKETLDTMAKTVRLKPFRDDELGDEDEYLLLVINQGQPSENAGVPRNREEWLFLAQELMQGVYEAAGKERPFELTYVDGLTEVRLTASFRDRRIVVQSGGNHQKTLPWSDLLPLMETIYAVHYDIEQAIGRPPRRDGQFINLGGDEWYELGKAVVEWEQRGALNRLKKRLAQLAE